MNVMTDPANQYTEQLTQSVDQNLALVSPLMASVAISGRCNSKCSYCGIWMHEVADLPLNDWILAVDELGSLGVQLISLSGGEPLLNRELEQIIRHIRAQGMISSLTTNGMSIRPDRLQSLREAGLNSLGISLDTLDPDTYTAIRGVPIWPVLRGLEYATQEMCKPPEFRVTINCVVSKKNINQIVPLVEYCSERGVFVGFQPLHGSSNDGLEPSLVFDEQDLAELNSLIDSLLRMQQEGYTIKADAAYLQGFPDFLVYQRLPPDFVCIAGFTTIAVDQHLNVKSCWSMEPVGNLRNSKLTDLWQSEAYSERRAAMMKLECPKCWYRCHTEYCSEDWLRGFLSWISRQKASWANTQLKLPSERD